MSRGSQPICPHRFSWCFIFRLRGELAAKILTAAGPLPAVHPLDGTKITTGVIYVAPQTITLLIENDRVADALFRSAAYVHGPRAIGVVLSGALDDGTSGLWSIERLSGITVVQQPNQARFESMPRSALEYVEVDHTVPSTEIGALLSRLIGALPGPEPILETDIKSRIAKEVQIADDAEAFQRAVMELGELTPFTCPECHGVLVRIAEGKMARFRCRMPVIYDPLLGRHWLEGVLSWMILDAVLRPRPAQDSRLACQRRTGMPCPCTWRTNFRRSELLSVVTFCKNSRRDFFTNTARRHSFAKPPGVLAPPFTGILGA